MAGHSPPRWGRRLLLALAIVVICGATGAFAAASDRQFNPVSRARVAVTSPIQPPRRSTIRHEPAGPVQKQAVSVATLGLTFGVLLLAAVAVLNRSGASPR